MIWIQKAAERKVPPARVWRPDMFPGLSHERRTPVELWASTWRLLLRVVVETAAQQQCVLVTGGWGTGVFQNPPKVVFGALKMVLPEIHTFCAYSEEHGYTELEVVYVDRDMVSVDQETPNPFGLTVVCDPQADMIQVAQKLANDQQMKRHKQQIFLHNFANGYQAGGGAANGKRAQEESIMQQVTNVMYSLLQVRPFKLAGEKHADWPTRGVAVTPDCMVGGTGGQPFSVISAAAPNKTNGTWRDVWGNSV